MEEKKTDPGELISIIIINWNGGKYLPACIDSVKAQNYEPVEVILVDNASGDNSLAGLPQGIVLIKNEVNQGFCRASNQGIKKAKGGIIILLNQDVILDKKFIENIYQTFLENRTAGMVSGKILRMDKRTIDSAGQFMSRWCKPVERGYNKIDRGRYNKDTEIFSVCGAAACYRRKMLEDIKIPLNPPLLKGERGGFEYFDEDYFAFNEDLDLGWRAQLKGWKAIFNPKAIAYHYRGSTQNKDRRFLILGRSGEMQHRIIFNRYLTIIKNISKTHFLLYFPFFFARGIIDLLFIILFIPDIKKIFNEMKLFRYAWEKRAVIQAGRSTPDKIIRKYII